MIKNINEAFDYIENQRNSNVSLSDFKCLFEKHNNFQNRIDYVHITGTNGKGSTSKMINDALINSDLKVGLFTSPHMIVANDRIRINNENISDENVIFYLNKYYADIEMYRLNFFQIYTLIALSYFVDKNCDIAIIEVGIGGLLDSTNVIESLVSVVTNINLDHTEKLGKSIEEIAIQKSGILKNNSVLITGVKDENALGILSNVAKDKHSKLITINDTNSDIISDKLNFTYNNHNYVLNSLAKYQVENALVSLEVIKYLNEHTRFKISDDNLKQAFENFLWTGRFERICSNPEVIIDGAHNIAGIKALINSDTKDSVVIFSALKDKDYEEMLELLIKNYSEVIFCEFDFYRSLSIEDLENFDIRKFTNINDSIDYMQHKYPNKRIIICGSLYFVSDVRQLLKGEDVNDSNN